MKTATRKANKALRSKGQPQPVSEAIANGKPAGSFREALSNVLLDVAKSAQKMVTEGTDFLLRSVTTNAHNWYECGIVLGDIKTNTSDASFVRLVNEVWSRFGLKLGTIKNWIRNSTVLKVACAEDQGHIDALLAVSNGVGLVSIGKDGNPPSLSGGYTAGIRKFPVRPGRSFEECMDWAREVQVVAEKVNTATPSTIADIYKSGMAKFDVLLNGNKRLNGNLEFAVHFVVKAYRELDTKSQPYAIAALEAIQDGTITLDAAGKRGSVLYRDAQKTEAQVKSATQAATKTVAAATRKAS